jgi:hypothetical protein
MLAGGVTKVFGVLATDSAMYDTQAGKTTFEFPKLFISKRRGYVMSFIGSGLYFNESHPEWFGLPFDELCKKMAEYLFEKRPSVAKEMEETIPDPDENKPHLCVMVMGMHKGYATVAQFNSFLDFQPKYLWTKDEPKFSTIIYGDDSKPEKAAIFKEATEYMELKSLRYKEITPGIMGEILTRGIYRKADEEMKIGLKKKYAGGIVNAAVVTPAGSYSLSGFQVIGG